MPERGVVDGVEGIFFSAGPQGPLEFFLAAGGRAVGIDGEAPAVVGQFLDHLGVVDVHGLAVLHMEPPGNAVVGVEEAAVNSCQHVLAFTSLAGAKL